MTSAAADARTAPARISALIIVLVVPLVASWRLMIVLSAVVLVPASAVAVLFTIVGLNVEATACLVAAAVFVISHWVHEFAHVLAYQSLGPHEFGLSPMAGSGTWRTAEITRLRLEPVRDAAVTLAGPFAGLACALLALGLSAWSFLVTPLALLFLSHVWTLTPHAGDGRALLALRR